MSTCPACRSPLAAEAKFCSECGQPALLPDGGRPTVSVGARSGAQTVSDGVTTTGGSLQLMATIAAVVIAIIALLVAGARDNSGDNSANDSPGESADDSADESAPKSTPQSGESASEEQTEAALKPSGSASSIEGHGGAAMAGYTLVAAGQGRLVSIDPGSNNVDIFDVAGEPVGLVGRELILFRPAEGFVAIDLDDPQAPIRAVLNLSDIAVEETEVPVERPVSAVIRADDTLLIEYSVSPLGSINAQSIIYQVDVDSGDFTRSTLDVGRASWWFGHGRLGLAWVPGGGLFDGLDGDVGNGGEKRKLSDGFPLLYGPDFVIVYECTEPGNCEIQWIDRMTGQLIDRTLPSIEELWFHSVEVGSGGRLLLVEGSDNPRYFDVDRGRWLSERVNEIQAGVTETRRFGQRPETVSSDGRWLAIADGAMLNMYDLDDEELYEFNVGGLVRGQRLFFVQP